MLPCTARTPNGRPYEIIEGGCHLNGLTRIVTFWQGTAVSPTKACCQDARSGGLVESNKNGAQNCLKQRNDAEGQKELDSKMGNA